MISAPLSLTVLIAVLLTVAASAPAPLCPAGLHSRQLTGGPSSWEETELPVFNHPNPEYEPF
ncbi:hypothetical protein IWQ62_003131 [Dispira parvispora]|uniref:Uncharacterized protein n=1 Tax=Dispira parvispora TaxID=1520584 RepID=A0A9W8AUB6_9FUNG|nr:hypothetical protein IWQ62_003131 [Dispira parvispora]